MQIFTQFTPELELLWAKALEKDSARCPFYSIAWHKAWFTLFGMTEKLAIAADPDMGIVVPLAIQDNNAHFSGGEEIADYLDAIGPDTHKADAWKRTCDLLKERGITSANLRNIPERSPSIEYFRSRQGVSLSREDTTPIVPLPQTFELYLTSLDRKNRHELKRKMRRFDESYADTKLRYSKDADVSISLLLSFMKNDSEKQKFLTPAMERFFNALPDIAQDKLIQFTLLYNDAPVATTLAFDYNETLFLYNSGFNSNIEGSGFYLKAKTIAWAIQRGYTSYNFLQGDERYKYELGGKDFLVYKAELTL